ncbi:MAG: HlyD family efflux transporter periplasmic adaptor subunit [Xanthomonadales bacterium]|nr:HlyD family efflux transporter periplasmic adaptor subunit [Xanthomonadales bacterium]
MSQAQLPNHDQGSAQGNPRLKIADTSGQDVVLEPPGNTRRWVLAGVGAVVLVVLLVLVVPWFQRWTQASISVPLDRLRLGTVERGDLVRDVSVQGRVVAAVSPTLFAPAAGTISLEVEAGAQVSEGQILARVDSPELTSQLEQERSTLDRLGIELERQRIEARQKLLDNQKNVDLAQVTLTAADREKRRADAARDIAAISEIDFEKAQDDLRNAQLAYDHSVQDAKLDEERLSFELKTRELQVERQRLLVDDLARQVDELAMRSPVNGIVGNLLVEQKSAVTRNQSVMAVVDLGVFEVEAQIPESYADDLGLGMPAEVQSGTAGYPASVVAVSPEIIQNQVTTRIRFQQQSPPGLRQNQRLTTRILLEEKPDVLMLPRGQFLDTGGGRVVYVVEDGLAKRRSIETGARSLASVEIVAGLAPGETVVLSSIDQFRGAETVLITQ